MILSFNMGVKFGYAKQGEQTISAKLVAAATANSDSRLKTHDSRLKTED
jgi:hypothetical protein